MVVLADVAAAAGVSIATASRALRGLSGVSNATRSRVVEMALGMDYVLAPVTLAAPRARVAVVVPGLGTALLAAAVCALATRLDEFGCVVELKVVPDPNERVRLWRSDALSRRVHGVVVVGAGLSLGEVADVGAIGVPVIGLYANVPGRTVGADEPELMRCATGHLLGLGHRRLGLMVNGDPEVALSTAALRAEAFREVVEGCGDSAAVAVVVPIRDAPRATASAAGRLFARVDVPTAVVADGDDVAVEVLAAARAAGLRVPRDLSVIALGGSRVADLVGLTSVTVDVEAQARRAAERLMPMVFGPAELCAEESGGQDVEPALVLRGSTAPPAITNMSRRDAVH